MDLCCIFSGFLSASSFSLEFPPTAFFVSSWGLALRMDLSAVCSSWCWFISYVLRLFLPFNLFEGSDLLIPRVNPKASGGCVFITCASAPEPQTICQPSCFPSSLVLRARPEDLVRNRVSCPGLTFYNLFHTNKQDRNAPLFLVALLRGIPFWSNR